LTDFLYVSDNIDQISLFQYGPKELMAISGIKSTKTLENKIKPDEIELEKVQST
jgi:hypothetical protein